MPARAGQPSACSASRMPSPEHTTRPRMSLSPAPTAAIAESTSRATIFIGSVSAGLVALGLIATATRIGTAFYAFGLVLLPTLAFVGSVTFERVLQSGIEDKG